MSKKIKPVGAKLLVKHLEEANTISVGGIEIVQLTLMMAEVMEVGTDVEDIYKKGDVVIVPKEAGIYQFYDKEHCRWINGTSAPIGDVWGKSVEDKQTKKNG